MEALDRIEQGVPMKRGQAGTMTHDYKRHVTSNPLAALGVATGHVMHKCTPRNPHQEFLGLHAQGVALVPKELDVHVIVDNSGTQARRGAGLARSEPASALSLSLDIELLAELRRAPLQRAYHAPIPASRLSPAWIRSPMRSHATSTGATKCLVPFTRTADAEQILRRCGDQ